MRCIAVATGAVHESVIQRSVMIYEKDFLSLIVCLLSSRTFVVEMLLAVKGYLSLSPHLSLFNLCRG